MWEVRNRTPFAAEIGFDRDRDGHEYCCLMVKGTFDLIHDAPLPVAQDQPAPRRVPVMSEDPARPELLADTDCVPFLPTSEFLVEGTVPAPQGKTKPYHDIGVRLGTIQKHARLFGPRKAKPAWIGWDMVSEGPVGDVPLLWSNAFGGTPDDPDKGPNRANPAGRGIEMIHGSLLDPDGAIVLPQVCEPDVDVLTDYTRARPVGFGPVSRHWEPRVGYAGTYDTKWEDERRPLLPRDFDPRFYLCAPADQHFPKPLTGGEAGRLIGFGPQQIDFRLPQIVLSAQVRFDRAYTDLSFRLGRVFIDASGPRLSLLWLASLRCDGREHLIEWATIRVRQMAGVAQ